MIPVALNGDFGKPRPALVIQADDFGDTDTVTVLLVTSMIVPAPLLRITVDPTDANGLSKPSQIMIDKAMTVWRDKTGAPFGRLDASTMVEVQRCLAVFLG